MCGLANASILHWGGKEQEISVGPANNVNIVCPNKKVTFPEHDVKTENLVYFKKWEQKTY